MLEKQWKYSFYYPLKDYEVVLSMVVFLKKLFSADTTFSIFIVKIISCKIRLTKTKDDENPFGSFSMW